eukprot:COSAG02_NODE_53085_length_304_cov_0.541463_1_plen_51_part_10
MAAGAKKELENAAKAHESSAQEARRVARLELEAAQKAKDAEAEESRNALRS